MKSLMLLFLHKSIDWAELNYEVKKEAMISSFIPLLLTLVIVSGESVGPKGRV